MKGPLVAQKWRDVPLVGLKDTATALIRIVQHELWIGKGP